MPGVRGRLDHFTIDTKHDRMMVAALGNNTVEVYQGSSDTILHQITGLDSPQGMLYIPEFDKLVVSDDNGKVRIYDGSAYDLLSVIDYGEDANADNLRYDPAAKRIYVAYADAPDGAIGTIDPATNRRLPEVYKTGAHPESFQLERSGPRIFANLPDGGHTIAVIDRKTGRISKWRISAELNFPMALDEADHRLFVGTRKPPRLLVLNTDTGKTLASLPAAGDTDDLYYDAALRRVYVIGGTGSISVFQQSGPDHYAHIAEIPTAVGARTGFFTGGPDELYGGKYTTPLLCVGAPYSMRHPAALLFFETQP